MATPITSYDPFDPAIIAEPYGHYAFLRDRAPCHRVERRDIYVLSRYEDVRAALANTHVFSSTEGVGFERRPVPMMIAQDPPQHTRLRRIVAGRFTPRALAQWNARIQTIASELFDPLVGAGTVDFASELAAPFPVQVIAEMMDVPVERRADFKRWSDNTVVALSGAVGHTYAERAQVEAAILEFGMYFDEVIRERAPYAAERDDLVSLLLSPNDDGEQLDAMEIISFCVLLLVAGNETTTNLIGNTVDHFARHPEDWERVRRDPTLVRSAIEESLRYDAPIQGFFRNTRQAVEIAGRLIPRGEKVMLLYAAANRDPRKYDDPDVFRIDRNPTDHIAFGFGPHTCLGAHLARMEARILFERAASKVARFELAGPTKRTNNPLLRGFEHLPVRLVADPRS